MFFPKFNSFVILMWLLPHTSTIFHIMTTTPVYIPLIMGKCYALNMSKLFSPKLNGEDYGIAYILSRRSSTVSSLKFIFRIRSSNTISMLTHWTKKLFYYWKIHVDFYADVLLDTFRNPLPDTTDFDLPDVTLIYKAVVMVWVITGQTELLIGRLSQLQTRGVDY